MITGLILSLLFNFANAITAVISNAQDVSAPVWLIQNLNVVHSWYSTLDLLMYGVNVCSDTYATLGATTSTVINGGYVATSINVCTEFSPLFGIDFFFTLILALGIFFGLELAIFIYKSIMWVIKKIPGMN